ncbi:GntR family transcriptional regulator [Robbsia andropogonis]|uniref:GntR family transcriptional regulator n=1 Tax=Robbsia andropogonis TaxID=28092 RepID=A0A0F5K120_9BURK|nr:GntR family transcriptional regulator [Robbsia andropogonis]KKB63798.1 GntR family transcriptional regulator [Robbsia andropogonis]MCP1116546.1 GntR family transcriptional regulator [Robbsia andropogonis]MCP1126775.1 GntR family transcriptional regulator [Robbsia andropogonis]
MHQSDLIFEKLREMILTLALRPGEQLSERTLEAQLDGSRTPIRAALMRLENEDLVQRDTRGWRVTPIDTGELTLLSEYREAIEVTGVRAACERATDQDVAAVIVRLDRVRDICNAIEPAEQWRDQWHRAGTDFHIELARLSGNPFIVKSIERVMTRLARVRWLEVSTPARREQSWQEHKAIVTLIQARRADDAAQAASRHIRDTHDRLLRSLREDRQYLRAQGLAVDDTLR